MNISNHKEKQDKEWLQWQGDINSPGKERFAWVLDKMKEREIKTVLDAGCAMGWHTNQLNDKYETLGTDISSVAIERAKREFPKCKFRVEAVEEIQDNYDAIMCIAVLNMVEDDELALDVISKHCKWGYLAFQTYRNHYLHLKEYDAVKVRNMLEKYGEIENLETIKDFVMVEIKFKDDKTERPTTTA